MSKLRNDELDIGFGDGPDDNWMWWFERDTIGIEGVNPIDLNSDECITSVTSEGGGTPLKLY